MARVPENLTEYERRRQENILRNESILSQLRRKAAEVSTAFASARPKKQPRASPTTPSAAPRRSGRAHVPPPSSAALPSSHLKPRPAHFSLSEAFVGVADASRPLASAILAASWPPEAKIRTDGFHLSKELVLKPGNARKLLPNVILAARVLPLADRTVVAVGNSLGHLVFWDADYPAAARAAGSRCVGGVFDYIPHKGAVGGITTHPAAPRKIYSCSHHGEICLMDVEKEIFNMIYLGNYPALSLCHAPNNANCLYFGEGDGELKAFDERAGEVSGMWKLHRDNISSIDINPENTYMLATSSLDRKACVWDLRSMKRQEPESLKVVQHTDYVHSAYFSSGGSLLATTSRDGTVGMLNVRDFDNLCFFEHACLSTTSKASWGWNDSDLLLGNQRAISIISVDLKENGISTSCKARFESKHMTEVPSQFAVHPYQVGHLACVGHHSKVFLWQELEQKNLPCLVTSVDLA